ncbi:cyclic lactone autoinducer peptide [Paenibacillus sp. YYML68]|nr:cyclic lactone autoinducer peptide [Paenibacillus sp. YYML68]
MKKMIAVLANGALVALATMFMTTNTVWTHRPELPTELLKK